MQNNFVQPGMESFELDLIQLPQPELGSFSTSDRGIEGEEYAEENDSISEMTTNEVETNNWFGNVYSQSQELITDLYDNTKNLFANTEPDFENFVGETYTAIEDYIAEFGQERENKSFVPDGQEMLADSEKDFRAFESSLDETNFDVSGISEDLIEENEAVQEDEHEIENQEELEM